MCNGKQDATKNDATKKSAMNRKIQQQKTMQQRKMQHTERCQKNDTTKIKKQQRNAQKDATHRTSVRSRKGIRENTYPSVERTLCEV